MGARPRAAGKAAERQGAGFWRPTLLGAGGGALLTLLLLLLFTAIAGGREDPKPLLPVLGRLAWILGGFFTGLLGALLWRRQPLLGALSAGGVYLFALTMLSLGLGDGSVERGILSLLLSGVILLALAFLGGLLTLPRKNRRSGKARRLAKRSRRGYR